ncbi:type IV secretory system conjugative DNA transfer family protein [Pandoraea sp. ISTKB]|uniref:type IV secretory system conjugative DNA transfer family protein n=1 Tax=Pandoraea sp. ISTKB TaxID=1586708 RepID=UPI0009F48F76|nr:type IV secretory system conjugative DNA transfer family protein [Pandoraea sp. ISTKB]
MPIDNTVTLESLQSLSQPAFEQRSAPGAAGGDLGNFRLNALRDAAIGVGARGGLISETALINETLLSQQRKNDVDFNFSLFMIQGRVVPPVLNRVDDIYAQRGDQTIRIAKTEWAFQAQARFTSRAPSWREYLLYDAGQLSPPSAVLYPQNSAERQIWQQAVAEGWANGVKQADEIYQLNLNRLTRDYEGMKNYHVLALKGVVTMPIVARMQMPLNTTGERMSVDESLLRLTVLPSFNTDMKNWKALGNEEGRLQQPGEDRVDPPNAREVEPVDVTGGVK